MNEINLGLPASQVLTGELDRRARAHDASHFLLQPRAIAVPRDADEVARLLRGCAAAGLGVTFRSGGTSLSGQAGSDAILADVRRHFDALEILDGGVRVRVEPGVTVNRVNAHLAAYGRQIGPDPASSAACTIGGVVANNSSGMACGTVENCYRTVESLVVVLASGTVIDTAAPDADARLRDLEPDLYEGLIKLRRRILDNPASTAKIKQQFSMKNTMGYGLNSFLDHERPAEILAHLMIGSEGTLGFVASATFRTVPLRRFIHTGLLVFDDLHAANRALPDLVATGAATLELMDAASIRVGQALPGCPPQLAAIQAREQAALLLEYQATSDDAVLDLVAGAQSVLAGLPVAQPVRLTQDPGEREQLWVLRKGLYTSVAAARRPGTTALLEDVVVPVERLADACTDLAGLFDEFAYRDSVIFGHAKDGNIHFMITDQFERQLERYERFTEAMVDVILGYDGSLKAEHGTGRVMAPFVRRQYGDELYDVMCEVKRLFDPGRLLNDGVVISDDPRIHLKHIKVPQSVDPLVDACVECGYCEPVCPARNLTLTPRQRIALRREIGAARGAGAGALAQELERGYVYDGVHTCAVDGMCATACPVGINTGVFIKGMRADLASPVVRTGWKIAADHWAGATHVASFAMSTVQRLKAAAPVITAVDQAGRAIIGEDILPLWSPELPGGGRSRWRPAPDRPAVAVYIPACVNAMFGPAEETENHKLTWDARGTGRDESFGAADRMDLDDADDRPDASLRDNQRGAGKTRRPVGVQAAFEFLCACAGVSLVVPDNIDSLCCGTPWTSKGMHRGRDVMAARVIEAVRLASDYGKLPVVCDASSCTEGLQRTLADEADLRVIDCVQFTAETILPRLGPVDQADSVTLHPTCSSTQIGLNPDLVKVAQAAARQVNVPLDVGCCAFAGDRGLLHPELTHAATRPEAAEVAALAASHHASCNRTCELGLTRATGQTYRHILEILADHVRM